MATCRTFKASVACGDTIVDFSGWGRVHLSHLLPDVYLAMMEDHMPTAFDLMQRHFETLVDDNVQWRTLITDEILWELV